VAQRPRTVLLPLLNLAVAPDLLTLAASLIAGQERFLPHSAHVLVLAVVTMPEGQTPAEGRAMARAYRAMLSYLPATVTLPGPQGSAVPLQIAVHRLIKVAPTLDGGIREAVTAEQIDLLLLHWKGYANKPERNLFGQTLDGLLQQPPCNLLLARSGHWQDAGRILLPLRGGPNAELALEVGLDLGARLGVGLTVLHGVPRAVPTAGGRRTGDAPYLALQEKLEQAVAAATTPIEQLFTLDTDVPGRVAQQILSSDLIILGAPDRGPQEPLIRNALIGAVLSDVARPVLIARAARPLDMAAYHARLGTLPEAARSAEQWFVENTYYQDEFANMTNWRAVRANQEAHISVVLPTHNDAPRIESLLLGLRHALQLQPEAPIADQILVVDAASEDATPALVVAQGVTVLRVQGEPHSRRGRPPTPGPAALLREALNLAGGNILVWLDPKAGKLHPSFVPALVGPLLHDPGVLLVKPFWTSGGPEQAEDEPAGRPDDARFAAIEATDLLNKSLPELAGLPIYSWVRAFYPRLGALMYPFGNVFAARITLLRELLPVLEECEAGIQEGDEAGPFSARLAFAASLVLETAARHGTRAIAQVEMQRPARGGAGRRVASPDMRHLRHLAELLALFLTRPDAALHQAALQELRARILRVAA
jgi:glucosyl-3-phosphoglycerate synthase